MRKALDKPAVIKMAGIWLWSCDHGYGTMGDQFHSDHYRDPWSCALATALKHSEMYHSTAEGEEV